MLDDAVEVPVGLEVEVDEEIPATALMVDLRGFTNEMSATLGDRPGRSRFMQLLGELNGVVVTAVEQAVHPGLRDELAPHVHLGSTGDGALVVFRHPRHHVRHGAIATLLIRAAVSRMCMAYAQQVQRPLSFGVGIESGSVTRVSAAGPVSLSSYIGACINAAARVESITRDIHRTEVIFCEHTVQALAELLLEADYTSRMRSTKIPAGSISDAEYLSSERDLVALNRQLCLDYLHQHLLRGFSRPTALFRLSKSSATLGNPRFDRLLELLADGESAWLDEIRAAL